MESEGKRQELCVTCNDNRTCYLKRGVEREIIFCEEFDNFAFPRKRIVAGEGKQQEQQDLSLGLCVNCEARENCVNIRTTPGRIFCECYI